ncbi:hypothetical protein CkaCkLH20_03851 [Colletotrichum karsti]|uniref:Glucan 4-alpha-glucosidase n=1 Tax=Colletotrichum karsti TaxID=1095194 RepID=A0A9P6IBV0_9PEZI|nr:uncharacterized protein CkaCkLH20_03851 [Colletotrichum karsti]KAF9878951.1 hypothetical protein CkaCkLH20_03851 [Colletotrichum karsti]
MSTQTGTASRRPKLSLSIKTSPAPHTTINRSLALVDPKSPTTFNTLSNVYATAIGRSTPALSEPLTAIDVSKDLMTPQQRIQTPYAVSYPETPLTAHPLSPAASMEITFPSTMTATPPLSAGPVDGPQMFGFSPIDTQTPLTALLNDQPTPRSLRKRNNLTLSAITPPYTHPRSLHSILRNSPLPPPSAKTPISPRRQSLRLQEKAARRVAYNSPIEQTIITNTYTKSHIDLLIEDASPASPRTAQEQNSILDIALAFTGNETLDGGMTPGPFEEMRRRMAGLAASSPVVSSPAVSSPAGIRKKKRKEKKRRWVWTIGNQEEDPENLGGAVAALRAAEAAAKQTEQQTKPAPPSVEIQACSDLPTPSVETFDEAGDVEMSDTSSVSCGRGPTPGDMEVDLSTPTLYKRSASRIGSVDLFNPDTGSRRDTPIPPDLVVA